MTIQSKKLTHFKDRITNGGTVLWYVCLVTDRKGKEKAQHKTVDLQCRVDIESSTPHWSNSDLKYLLCIECRICTCSPYNNLRTQNFLIALSIFMYLEVIKVCPLFICQPVLPKDLPLLEIEDFEYLGRSALGSKVQWPTTRKVFGDQGYNLGLHLSLT